MKIIMLFAIGSLFATGAAFATAPAIPADKSPSAKQEKSTAPIVAIGPSRSLSISLGKKPFIR